MKRQNSKEEKASSLLFEGDRKLRTLVENLPGIVFRCKNDSDRTMQFISNECKCVTGYWPEQFCKSDGIAWGSLIHPMDKDDVWNAVQLALGKNEKFQLKYRIIDKEGKIHWISETGIAVEKKEGTAYLEGYMQDITTQIMGGNINVIKERALDEVGNGIIIANAQLKQFPIIHVNQAFERITGYSKEEVVGKNCNFLQSDDRQQKEIQIIRDALANQSPCHVEIRNYGKDGTMFWNELSITPVRNLNGETTHFIGIQNDITERKNLEFLRKGKNDIFEMIIKKRPLPEIFDRVQEVLEQQIRIGTVAITLYDDAKQMPKRVSGSKTHPAIGKVMDQILATSDSCPCIRAIQSKKRVRVANILDEPSWSKYRSELTKAGFKSISSSPILDADNHILGVLSAFCPSEHYPFFEKEELVDEMVGLIGLAIEQKKIREKLQTNQKHLETYSKGLEKQVEQRNKDLKKILDELMVTNFELIEQVTDANAAKTRAEIQESMLLAITQNFPKGAIILVDKKMQINLIKGAELKHLQDQVYSKKASTIMEFDGLSTSSKRLLKYHMIQALKGKHLSFEIEYKNSNYIINTTPILSKDGEVTHAVLVLLNISERKRNEERILKNLKKEKELSELKTRFISTASHEFRTPLSIILSSTSLIEKLNGPEKTERRLFHLERIKTNVEHLVNILNDFLSLTKLEEGETKPTPEFFDLLQLSKSLIQQMEVNTKNGQSIVLECNHSKIEIYLDPKLVQHILLNLVSNAIKYSDENQPIILRIEEESQKVKIQVIDQGIGIPEEDKPYLFRRFFRARNSINVQGTGLGLHIVKSYTELMRGELWYESKENHGTSFELKFPKHYKNEKSIGN